MARGSVTANGLGLKEGDGAAVSEVGRLDIMALDRSEVLLFDLA
jgi:hypothetical protein